MTELNINIKYFKENVFCTGSTDCGDERYKFYGPLQFGLYSLQVWSIEKTDKIIPAVQVPINNTGDTTPIGSAPSQRSLLLRSSDYELTKDKPKFDPTIIHERDRRYVPISRKPDKTNYNESESSGVSHYIPIKRDRSSNEGFATLINNKPRKRNHDSIQELHKNPIHQDPSEQDREDQNELDEEHHERLLGVHSEGPNKKDSSKNITLEIHNIHRIQLPHPPEHLDSSFPLFHKSQTSRDCTKSDIDYSAKWQFNLYKNGVFVDPKSDTNLSEFEWTHYKNSWQDQIFTTRQITNILGNLHKRFNTDQVQVR
jgi:hypothetical protein